MTAQKKNPLRRRLMIWGSGLAILAMIGVSLIPKPEPADFVAIENGALQVTIDEEGATRVRDRYLVSAPYAGRVLRIELEPGDPVVARETILATFQPNDPVLLDARSRAEAKARVRAAEAAVGRVEAELERARAELRFSDAELGRYRKLASEEIVSAERLEQAELERDTKLKAVRAAEFTARATQHDLDVARARLVESGNEARPGSEPIAIRSPVSGTVLRRLRESEAVVPAGEPLLEVADPQHLEIVSDLLSTDAVRVQQGQRVLVERWGGEHALHAVVRRVEPYGFTKISALGVEEQRVNVVMDFDDPRQAWEALGDGYRVEVRIVIWEQDDVVLTPTSSLFRSGEQWATYVVDAGVARLREIDIGQRNGLQAQVLTGLEAGDMVIVHPSDAIGDGVKVEQRGS